MRAGRRVATAVIAAAAVLAPACTGHPAAGQGPAVRLAVCGGRPQARPTVVVIGCANNSIIVKNLAWSGWGRPVATAVGTAVVNLCAVEDCFNSDAHAYPVVLIASGTRGCPQGLRAYSQVQYVFAGRSPLLAVPARLMSAGGVPQATEVVTVGCH